MRCVDPARLVVVDESGANLAMGRSHAWVRRGEEYVEPRPMNWGKNLTLVGAIRPTGWVALSTDWGGMTTERFTRWVRRRLVPRLRRATSCCSITCAPIWPRRWRRPCAAPAPG
jgi:hypothetical protein